jgi:hypothetical protein
MFSSMAFSNQVHSHLENNTKNILYVSSNFTDTGSCFSISPELHQVSPGDSYEFNYITSTGDGTNDCHVDLLAYADESKSNLVGKEHFVISIKDNYADMDIVKHDTPPSICGLGMTCSINLENSNKDLYLSVSDKDNQYAHVNFVNGDFSNPVYIRILKADDSDCTDSVDGSYHKVDPSKSTTDYIRNTHIGKFCKYNVTIATDSKGDNAACGYDVTIGNDSNDSTYVENVDNQAVKLPTYNCFIGDDTNKFETTLTAAPIR